MLGCLYFKWRRGRGRVCEIHKKTIGIHSFFQDFVEGTFYASSLYP